MWILTITNKFNSMTFEFESLEKAKGYAHSYFDGNSTSMFMILKKGNYTKRKRL